jgi:hypothetical protein
MSKMIQRVALSRKTSSSTMLLPLKLLRLLQAFQVLKALLALQVPQRPPEQQHAYVIPKFTPFQSSKLTIYSPLLLHLPLPPPLLFPLRPVPPQSLLLQVGKPIHFVDHNLANK